MADPVAVGGLGGSGTRVYATLLLAAGIEIGARNEAEDSHAFSTLIAVPLRHDPHLAVLDRQIAAFCRVMAGERPTTDDLAAVALGLRRTKRSVRRQRAVDLVATHRAGRAAERWGWKNPPTHLLLRGFARHVDGLRYVHVVRHGLNMATSRNLNQLREFGWRFGVAPPDGDADPAQAQLEFWIRANRSSIETGRQLLGDRFLLSRYDDLCLRPDEELDRLIGFLDLSGRRADEVRRQVLADLDPVGARPRWDDELVARLPDRQLDAVRDLGFDVP